MTFPTTSIAKRTSVPVGQEIKPSTIYIVSQPGSLFIDVYVSNKTGTELKSIISESDILGMIQQEINKTATVTLRQDVASADWIFAHAFPYKPKVSVIDSTGREVYGDVSYPTETTVRIQFSAPFSGEVTLR